MLLDVVDKRDFLTATMAIGFATVIFAVPTLYNGFPFVFHDTASYVYLSFHPMRTPFYSLFILLLHWNISLWPVVFAQAFIIAHLLFLTLRVTFGLSDPLRYLIVCLALAVGTSLPWFVGQIMPDIFVSVVVLCSFLLLFASDRLHRFEVIYLFFLLAGATSLHLTAVPIALGLAIVALLYKLIIERNEAFRVRPFALHLGAVGLAIAGLLLANAVMFGNVALSSGGKAFLMARSIADGPGKQYLEESCPEKQYRLCAYLDDMPNNSDDILWNDGPFIKAGGVEELMEESDEIFTEAFKRYPIWHLELALRNTVDQLFMFATGQELISYLYKERLGEAIEENVPGSISGWRSSKQNLSELPLSTLSAIGYVTAAVSFAVVLGLCIVFWRRGDWLALSLMVMVVAALLGNAMISGAVSGPHDRYQSRVVWLLTVVAVAGLLHCFSRPREQNAKDQRVEPHRVPSE